MYFGHVSLLIGGALLLFVPTHVADALGRTRALVFLPLAAAAYTVAHAVTWDSYYAPTPVRYVEHGAVSWAGLALLGAVAVGAAVACRRTPDVGLRWTALVMWLSAIVAMLTGSGH